MIAIIIVFVVSTPSQTLTTDKEEDYDDANNDGDGDNDDDDDGPTSLGGGKLVEPITTNNDVMFYSTPTTSSRNYATRVNS